MRVLGRFRDRQTDRAREREREENENDFSFDLIETRSVVNRQAA